MKLETVFAISMALALPATITAQSDVVDDERNMSASFSIDPAGLELNTSRGYAGGTTILLFGLEKLEGEGIPIPAALGGGEIHVVRYIGEPLFNQADQDGNYSLNLSFDARALADAGVVVHVQAFSINSSDWPDVPAEPTETGPAPILISDVMTLDFRLAMARFDEEAASGDGGDENNDTGDGDPKEGETIR